MGEEFDRWAMESRKDSKSLSIHTKRGVKRTAEEAEAETEPTEETEATEEQDGGSEAHHCTIIGHISMVTDLQVLPLKSLPGGLIVTCDRDEKFVSPVLTSQKEFIPSAWLTAIRWNFGCMWGEQARL